MAHHSTLQMTRRRAAALLRLDLNLLTIVGQLDVGGQLGIDFGMAADVVAGVDEPRLTGSNAAGKGDGLVDGLMGVVRLLAQGVDNEGVAALDIGYLLGVDNFQERLVILLHNRTVSTTMAFSSRLKNSKSGKCSTPYTSSSCWLPMKVKSWPMVMIKFFTLLTISFSTTRPSTSMLSRRPISSTLI